MTATDVAAFDADLVARVASEYDVDATRLGELAAEVQSAAESVRSVDELVFEYRKSFGDVVAERTPSAYFLRVPPHVWPEYARRLSTGRDELDALKALHAAGFDEVVAADRRAEGRAREKLVLARR